MSDRCLHSSLYVETCPVCIDDLKIALAEATSKLGDALKALEVAKCPNCDGSGGTPVRVSVDEWEQEQCQWCYEKFALLNDSSRVVETPDEIRDEWGNVVERQPPQTLKQYIEQQIQACDDMQKLTAADLNKRV